MATDGAGEHGELGKAAFRPGTFVAAVLIVAVPAPLAFQLLGPPGAAVTMFLAPVLAGLIASKSGARPVFRGASACALGTLLFLLAEGLVTGYFPDAGRDLVPSCFVVIYSTAVGGFVAWGASRRRLVPEDGPLPPKSDA